MSSPSVAAIHSALPIAGFVWVVLLASLTTAVARKVGVPYTVALVLVGALVSGLGLLTEIHLTSDVILLVFLPPLLFEAGLQTDIKAFGRTLPIVLTLAVPNLARAPFTHSCHFPGKPGWSRRKLITARCHTQSFWAAVCSAASSRFSRLVQTCSDHSSALRCVLEFVPTVLSWLGALGRAMQVRPAVDSDVGAIVELSRRVQDRLTASGSLQLTGDNVWRHPGRFWSSIPPRMR